MNYLLTFWRNISTPSSGSKNKPNKNQHVKGKHNRSAMVAVQRAGRGPPLLLTYIHTYNQHVAGDGENNLFISGNVWCG
jgi:hypothetical protein